MNEHNENNEHNEQTIHKSVQQDGKPVIDTEPEVSVYDAETDDDDFVSIGDLTETYNNLFVMKFKHPTDEGRVHRFLLKRNDGVSSWLTMGTAIVRSAIRLATMQERLKEGGLDTSDIFQMIDDLKNTKEGLVYTVALHLIKPRIPAKDVNKILPDAYITAMASEINKGAVVLGDATSQFHSEVVSDTSESGQQPASNGIGDSSVGGNVGNQDDGGDV